MFLLRIIKCISRESLDLTDWWDYITFTPPTKFVSEVIDGKVITGDEFAEYYWKDKPKYTEGDYIYPVTPMELFYIHGDLYLPKEYKKAARKIRFEKTFG